MRFKLPISLSNQKLDDNFVRFVANAFDLMTTIFNGRVDFIDNCDTAPVSVVFGKANTQQAVAHGLNRVPRGYFMTGALVSGVVYSGASTSNAQYLFLQATVVGTYNLLIF